ncbi:hypothetical protein Tco_0682699 [Tanacetum coccineum]|uniref:Uncharacterized protein n=1 Tax=Tanacetum coccineum TaxID=301880 RepID=A0ABQ4XRW2_9ASTR
MVACLEKSEGNTDFHEIVDFLTVRFVHYALTITLAEPFNDVYQTPAHTKKVFTNMKRKGLFASMLAPPVVEGEGSDEVVFKEWDDRVVRATTTAATGTKIGGNTPGSDGERIEQDDLTDFVPPTPHDSPLSGGHTSGSDEDSSRFGDQKAEKEGQKMEKKLRARTTVMKLFKIGTSRRKSLDKANVSKHGRKSDKTKTMFIDSDFAELDVDNAMENVEGDAKTQGRNTAKQITTAGDTVNTASIDVSVAGPLNVSTADPSTNTAGDIFEDEMMTIADTLVAIRSTRPRKTSVEIHDVEEEPRRATPIATVQSQDKDFLKKNKLRIARERVAEQEAKDAALIEKMEDIQARIDADELLA